MLFVPEMRSFVPCEIAGQFKGRVGCCKLAVLCWIHERTNRWLISVWFSTINHYSTINFLLIIILLCSPVVIIVWIFMWTHFIYQNLVITVTLILYKSLWWIKSKIVLFKQYFHMFEYWGYLCFITTQTHTRCYTCHIILSFITHLKSKQLMPLT